MKYNQAIKSAKEGKFEFIYEPVNGQNEVRYQTTSGKWKHKYIQITDAPKHQPIWGAIPSDMQEFML